MNSLQLMADFLNENGWNYGVFLKSFEGSVAESKDLEASVGKLLGEAVLLDDVSIIGKIELFAEITECLSFVGSEGEGVEPALVQGLAFLKLLNEVLNEVETLATQSTLIQRFVFKAGHPDYPVFWAFSYFFSGLHNSTLLIGSSSD